MHPNRKKRVGGICLDAYILYVSQSENLASESFAEFGRCKPSISQTPS